MLWVPAAWEEVCSGACAGVLGGDLSFSLSFLFLALCCFRFFTNCLSWLTYGATWQEGLNWSQSQHSACIELLIMQGEMA